MLIAASWAMASVAQGSDALLRDKITDAVMKVYDDQLAKDPNDYNTLFQRASQLYNMGYLVDAKADIDRAIELTPGELESAARNCQGWIDVCKDWDPSLR